jgi:Flp pilus assembly protein TadG
MTALSQRRRRLDDRGTTSMEFALIVPLLFLFIFSLIESYFALFNFQQVQAVASETARCVAIGSSLCSAGGAAYAVNKAAPGHAIGALTQQMVAVNTNTSCGGTANMTRITITYPLANALPLNVIPAFMANYNLIGVGCFPNINS